MPVDLTEATYLLTELEKKEHARKWAKRAPRHMRRRHELNQRASDLFSTGNKGFRYGGPGTKGQYSRVLRLRYLDTREERIGVRRKPAPPGPAHTLKRPIRTRVLQRMTDRARARIARREYRRLMTFPIKFKGLERTAGAVSRYQVWRDRTNMGEVVKIGKEWFAEDQGPTKHKTRRAAAESL